MSTRTLAPVVAVAVVAPIPGAALAFSLVLTALMTVDSVLEDEFSRWARDRMTALSLGVAFGGALGLAHVGSNPPQRSRP